MPKFYTFKKDTDIKYLWFVKKEFFDQPSLQGIDPSTLDAETLIAYHKLLTFTHNLKSSAIRLIMNGRVTVKSYWINGEPDSNRNYLEAS